MHRQSVVVPNGLAWHHQRFLAAQRKDSGLRIFTLQQLAARLAGGFLEALRPAELQELVKQALDSNRFAEIEPIKNLPGTPRAICATLRKAWNGNLDLQERRGENTRLADLALIEQHVSEHLPAGRLLPTQLIAAARRNVRKAPQITGALTVEGIVGLPQCWTMLFLDLGLKVPVEWRAIEAVEEDEDLRWLEGSDIKLVRQAATGPVEQSVVCANPKHEAIEAFRWVRQLIASGRAAPHQIAIAASSVENWDDHMRALADDSLLPICFVHGRKATSSFPGQQAAALAEVLLQGLSQDRVVRALRLVTKDHPDFEKLPADWYRKLNRDAPLLSREHWQAELDRLAGEPAEQDWRSTLGPVLDLLAGGPDIAPEAGVRLLKGQSLALWEQALRDGPPAALETTLGDLRLADGADPVTSILWGPAAALAGIARPFMRLLGLSSRGWPRGYKEDPLLPAHILRAAILEPISLPELDRLHFRRLRAQSTEITYSRSRRDSEGRLLGISPLFPTNIETIERRRAAVPEHALSEADRLLARPDEFSAHPLAVSSIRCYRDWGREEITAHDGLIAPGHRALQCVLARPQSPASLRVLLTDPLGFVWKYALGWREPADVEGEEPIVLDPLAVGDLVHKIMQDAVQTVEREQGFGRASNEAIVAAVAGATQRAAIERERSLPTPPLLIWRKLLENAAALAISALSFDQPQLAGQRTYVELSFGDARQAPSDQRLWDPGAPVIIADLGMRITGRIDRLDVSEDGSAARIIDYKTVGKCPSEDPGLKNGAELQRCLYTIAVRRLLAGVREVEASLLYPATDGGHLFQLQNAEQTIKRLIGYIRVAHQCVSAGHAPPGVAAESAYNKLLFAYPSNAGSVYFPAKRAARDAMLEGLLPLWSEDNG